MKKPMQIALVLLFVGIINAEQFCVYPQVGQPQCNYKDAKSCIKAARAFSAVCKYGENIITDTLVPEHVSSIPESFIKRLRDSLIVVLKDSLLAPQLSAACGIAELIKTPLNASPAICKIDQWYGLGRVTIPHWYFSAVFTRTKSAIGYHLFTRCTSCSQFNLISSLEEPPVAGTPDTCTQGFCFSNSNKQETNGTIFMKICAVFEDGKEFCSLPKAFVYNGVWGPK